MGVEAKADQFETDGLLKKREVAEILACSSRTVDRLASLGKLARVRVLGSVRFRRSEVQGIVKGNSVSYD